MIITLSLSKRKGVLKEIVQGVKRLEMVVFVKATTGKSIIPAPIAKVRFETYQLVWCLVTQIVQGNQNVHR